MKKISYLLLVIGIGFAFLSAESGKFETDSFTTSLGELKIIFVGHGTIMLMVHDKVIHVDPVSRVADYKEMPQADIILVTHHHGDHLDASVITTLSKSDTALIWTKKCAENIEDLNGIIMKNGDRLEEMGFGIQAVPAYNIEHLRSSGVPYHPKGEGNGYVLTIGDTRIYIGGDTEWVPEMQDLDDIDIAFLPMNLPYTMTPEMTANAAKSFMPRILYPYHYGKTDTSLLEDLLKDVPDIEVRIRDMYRYH